ncbi:hypothetical protein QBC46DRAFT_264893 [Diplogelasinospora grovesii]|uniref:BTB domain-containing protein n=1 Tax=Diplogelasinospora grovesii TaxID=303347 RepID=A0AAN6N528_9PEZI|nr:hypothetical protein QBC46DRAFT_264893 [Diplogelasinospora grovesii]
MCDYIMDPSGDVILTLNNPNAPIAASVLFNEDKPQVRGPGGDWEPPPQPSRSWTFRLSSRHLIVASPVFKAALSGGVWKEGIASSDGDGSGAFFRIDTRDWDVDALVLVMSVIHGRNWRVPLEISFKTLVNVALVVDYYQVAEALRLASSLWMYRPLKSPESLGSEALLWVCVGWAFRDDAVFNHATRAVVFTSLRDIDDAGTLQLPIPSAVIGKCPLWTIG